MNEYLQLTSDDLLKEKDNIEKQRKFMNWISEFSKKVIFFTFILYVINNLFCLYLVFISFNQGNPSGIDAFISESNITFREICGGYLIKAAVENAIKIACGYYVKISNIKLDKIKQQLGVCSNDNNDESEIYEEIEGDDYNG